MNNQALVLELAETEIRKIVKEEYLKKTPRSQIDALVKKVILESAKRISIEKLKKASIVSLSRFYNAQYNTLNSLFGGDAKVLSSVIVASSNNASNKEKEKALETLSNKGFIPKDMIANVYGQANNEYMKKYMGKVAETLKKMAEMEAKDPEDLSNRNSLRNRAEMEVRYQGHLDNIKQLKSEGNKLVICSTHADCSKRCAKWQGRVFSLDGTSGVTDDGREYVPLEVATNKEQVFYTNPKTGTQYKGGLLGYNCRHYLVAYKSGFSFPQPNEKKERKEYAITLKQRQLERNVRHWRDIAIENKGIDKKKYLFAKQKATEWNKKYVEFSHENGRASFPSRTKSL